MRASLPKRVVCYVRGIVPNGPTTTTQANAISLYLTASASTGAIYHEHPSARAPILPALAAALTASRVEGIALLVADRAVLPAPGTELVRVHQSNTVYAGGPWAGQTAPPTLVHVATFTGEENVIALSELDLPAPFQSWKAPQAAEGAA